MKSAEWSQFGPLYQTITHFVGEPNFWLLLAIGVAMSLTAYFILAFEKEARIESFLPILLAGLVVRSKLLWVLPIYLFCVAMLRKHPRVTGFTAIVGTLLGIYPLLAILLIFFTKERRAFGIGAFVGLTIGFLLPLILYPPSEYLPALGAWYSGFRNPLPELQNGRISDYSLMGLLRISNVISPRFHWLVLVQVFHLLLLPCLRAMRSDDPSAKAEIYTGAVLTFIALFSGLNEPNSLIIATTGIMLWALYSRIYPRWLRYTAIAISWLLNLGLRIALMISPELTHTHTITIAALTLLPLLPIFTLQVIELWKATPEPRLN